MKITIRTKLAFQQIEKLEFYKQQMSDTDYLRTQIKPEYKWTNSKKTDFGCYCIMNSHCITTLMQKEMSLSTDL